jgi:hypothetical protein
VQQRDLIGELFSLYIHGAVKLDITLQQFYHEVPERPLATLLARAQAEMGLAHLATARHTTTEIDPFAARLVSYLDGTRARGEIIEHLVGDILDRQDLKISDAMPTDRARLTSQVAANCDRLLQSFARHGILQAPEIS